MSRWWRPARLWRDSPANLGRACGTAPTKSGISAIRIPSIAQPLTNYRLSLHGGVQRKQIDSLDACDGGLAVAAVCEASAPDRGRAPLEHRPYRTVVRDLRLPHPRISREAFRVVQDPQRRAIADDECRGYSWSQLHWHERAVQSTHLTISIVRVNSELGRVQRYPVAFSVDGGRAINMAVLGGTWWLRYAIDLALVRDRHHRSSRVTRRGRVTSTSVRASSRHHPTDQNSD